MSMTKTTTNSEQLLANIQKNKKEIETLKKTIKKTLKDTFKGLTKELFDTYPELKSFGWDQYTPYFNDGEPCEFRANTSDIKINGYDEYDDEGDSDKSINVYLNGQRKIWDDASGGEIANPNYNKRNKEIVNTLTKFLEQFDNEDYKNLFGDHVSVHITAKKIVVDDYDHD